jgi:uncharacterized protein YdeI (YjbR/CyaY-like superfamily)
MGGMMPRMSEPMFFESPAAFRAWLDGRAASAEELLVGYWKKATGRASMTWAESVDEALCHGWIDGVRRSLGDDAYCIRFTPRRRGSRWSAVNVRRVPELQAEGRMTAAGLAAFESRGAANETGYSYERREATLPPDFEATLRSTAGAWEYWERQPPGYRRTVAWWVISAKQEPTRQRRLARLVEACAEGVRLRGG